MKKDKTKKRINKYLMVTFLSLVIFCIIAGLYYIVPQILPGIRFLQGFENNSVNFRFSTKTYLDGRMLKVAKNPIYNKIVIAGIDDDTIDEFGGTFPFDRKVWADALNSLNDNPKRPDLVFFDIYFSDPSQKPESDKALIEAYKNYQGTLGEDIILETIEGLNINELIGGNEESLLTRQDISIKNALDYNSPRIQAMRQFELHVTNVFRIYNKVSPLLKELPEYLDFLGTANLVPSDNIYRTVPLIVSTYYKISRGGGFILTNVSYPSIVLAIVLKELNAGISNVSVEKDAIVIKDAMESGQRKDFRIPIDKGCQMNINYKAFPNSGYIRKIPFKDIRNTQLPEDSLLFIGMYSKKGSSDIYLTPLKEMFGVELLSYAVGTILSRDFIYDAPEWLNFFYILFLTLGVGLVTARGLRYAVVAAALSLLLPIVLGIIMFQFNIIVITFIPVLCGILALISTQVYVLFTEGVEKNFIKSTFSSYLNPELVDILIKNPDRIQLGGEDKHVTVLFSAIKNITDISEGLDAKKLIEYLNSYFSKMSDIVMETNGTLDKYIGDSVMAFWGAPIDIPEHALKACEASLRMLTAVESFNSEQEVKGYDPVIINIGINSGNITVGNVGSERQKNYTAIGDPVNLASRLKGINKFYHTQVIISEFTYELVKDSVIVREIDLTRVKGKLKPVRIYELLDIK